MRNPFEQPGPAVPSTAGSGNACDCSICDPENYLPAHQDGEKEGCRSIDSTRHEKDGRRSIDRTRHARFCADADPGGPSSHPVALLQTSQPQQQAQLQQQQQQQQKHLQPQLQPKQVQQQQQLDTGQAPRLCQTCGQQQPRGRRSAFAGNICEGCLKQMPQTQHPILRGVAARSMSEADFKLRVKQTSPRQQQELGNSKCSSISSEQAEEVQLRQTWSGLTHYSFGSTHADDNEEEVKVMQSSRGNSHV